MNPQNNEASGINLPPPIMEQAPAGVSEVGQQSVEQGIPAGPERAAGVATPSTAMPASVPMPMPIVPMPMPVAQPGPAPVQTTAAVPAIADDDLIEKEWVNKAKQIVERTRDDPYKQSEELTHVKVDYMKKRYNKTIKLNK